MFEEINCGQALAQLHESRMGDLPALKFSLQLKDRARYLRSGSLLIVTFPPDRILYDAADYGYAKAIHLINGDGSGLNDYLGTLPPGKHILKGSRISENGLDPLFRPVHKARFISFTAPKEFSGVPSPRIGSSLDAINEFRSILKEVHYAPDEIARLIGAEGQFLSLKIGGKPAGCCVIYRNYGEIWEIGAVSVAGEFRRRGLGRELVNHAASLLNRDHRFIRYQMNEENSASRALAVDIGLEPFLTYRHLEITRGEGVNSYPCESGSD